MTDELCAREGCGAPKAWHDRTSTVEDLAAWRGSDDKHTYISPGFDDGDCLGYACACPAYVPPEPPKPERKPFVILLDEWGEMLWIRSDPTCDPIPLGEYLAAHPEARWPAYDDLLAERAAFERVAAKLSESAPLCVCGGREDEHDEDGRCSHVAKWVRALTVGSPIMTALCYCSEFRPEEASDD